MRSFVLFLLLQTAVCFGEEKAPSKKTICLNMIVKNEKQVIARCLKSVLPIIDNWVIVDTGSTDGTQEIIKDVLRQLPGKLYERPWVNFGYNRNEALSLAKDEADYILFMDADDVLVFSDSFVLPDLTADFYYMPAGGGTSEFVLPRLVKASISWFWKGKIHEYVVATHETSGILLEEVRYLYINDGARSKDPATYQKDIALLQESIAEEPQTPRNYYYLAMTYLKLGEYEKALEAHQKRADMPGWQEEAFVSKYYIALIQHQLKKDLKVVGKSFLDAYLFYPKRIEPLFYLIEVLEKEGEVEKVYLLAKNALEGPLKKNGSVLVESWIYEYGIRWKHAMLAYKTDRLDEAIESFESLISRADIPNERLQLMKQMYESATEKKKGADAESFKASAPIFMTTSLTSGLQYRNLMQILLNIFS
jgi:glycosyltransferase involved in cell wall biosynthesis